MDYLLIFAGISLACALVAFLCRKTALGYVIFISFFVCMALRGLLMGDTLVVVSNGLGVCIAAACAIYQAKKMPINKWLKK